MIATRTTDQSDLGSEGNERGEGAGPLRIGIIIGSTRPGRLGESVARWVYDIARKRSDAVVELIDLKDYNLPHLDEPLSPSFGRYAKDHTKAWAKKVASLDAFVFVTPEYNHSTSGVLKNAIDFLYAEWNNKAAGFVSYGGSGGVRAVEHLRLVLGELQVADVRAQASFSLMSDFENFRTFRPDPSKEGSVNAMLDQVIAWGNALRPLRAPLIPGTPAAEGRRPVEFGPAAQSGEPRAIEHPVHVPEVVVGGTPS
jgi:NAD(P)H-dependent FMN reductase